MAESKTNGGSKTQVVLYKFCEGSANRLETFLGENRGDGDSDNNEG